MGRGVKVVKRPKSESKQIVLSRQEVLDLLRFLGWRAFPDDVDSAFLVCKLHQVGGLTLDRGDLKSITLRLKGLLRLVLAGIKDRKTFVIK